MNVALKDASKFYESFKTSESSLKFGFELRLSLCEVDELALIQQTLKGNRVQRDFTIDRESRIEEPLQTVTG